MSTEAGPNQGERPTDPLVGRVVGGKWRVVKLIGRGGMGAVYEGQNVTIGKRVALKFIDEEFARQPDVASRFQREAEAASVVESAHIVQVFDTGTTDDGLPYIVMELLRGEDLRGRLRRLGRLPVDEALHIMTQTLRGLMRAHEAGIVHRDLKPDNIFLVDRDDDALFAKIVDFGISKIERRPGQVGSGTLTRQGVVLGTPFYMSPEQAQALSDLDNRTDLWSIGAMLYECLAGQPPHRGDTYEQIIISICTREPVDLRKIDPRIPPSVASIVRKAMARERAERWKSATEMLEALRAAGAETASSPGSKPATIGSSHATGDGKSPGAGVPARTPTVAEADAASGVASDERTTAPATGPKTRVSWTSAGMAATELSLEPDGVPKPHRLVTRRLLTVGGAVMALAFGLTLVWLRRSAPPNAPDAVAITPLSANANPAPSVMAAPAPSGESAPSIDRPTVTLALSTSSNSPHGPGAPNTKGAKHPSPPSVAGAAAPAPAKGGSGVAGGLQIKTNFP